MSELIAVPTVEQINLEHQLATNKAAEAVQHATNCGLMLLQIKASLQHGEWLPWLNGEIESGRLKVKARQTRSYMQLAANWQRDANLTEAPSIRAALELLSDQEPEEQQGELIDVEAERQARLAAEQKAEEEQRRSSEWRDQWKGQRDLAEKALDDLAATAEEKGRLQLHIAALERRIDADARKPAPKPQIVEKAPADYETLKAKAAQLETELATNKAEQTRIIQSAIKAKLQGYQGEVDALETKKRNLEQQAKEYQDYLASLTGKVKQMEAQSRAFEKTRQALVDLASELSDFEPIDPDLTRKALALAEMHDAAAHSLRLVFEPARPALTVIQGGAA